MGKVAQNCERCDEKIVCDTHHFLPQAFFNGKGKTTEICPNCHRKFGTYLRDNKPNYTKYFDENFWLELGKLFMKGLIPIIVITWIISKIIIEF